MAQVQQVIKAYRVNKLLDKLAFAKKNAVRAYYGLPPIVPWYEVLYTRCMDKVRVSFMEICCPCVLYWRNRRRRMRTCCGRLGLGGTYENDVFKSFVGFVSGMFIALIIYFLMVFKMEFSTVAAVVVSSLLGCGMSVGLAFSQNLRCYTLLIAPQFFSSRGRTFLIIYAFMLVMTSPVRNATHNVLVLSETATCGQSLAYNQTREFVEAALSPLAGVVDGVRSMLARIKLLTEVLRKTFLALKRAVDDIASAVNGALRWLASIVDVCNDKMGEPYRKCKGAFDEAYQVCVDNMDFLDFVCGIVPAVSVICEIVRIGELLCLLAQYIKDLFVARIGAPVSRAIYDVYEMFYVNITIHYHYSLASEQSQSYDEVRNSIMTEIREKINSFNGLIDFLNNALGLTILFVFIKAIYYRQKYLTNESFDNRYITKELTVLDEKRKKKQKETIFPLKANENLKYIKTWTFFLTLAERRKMLRGVVMYLSSAVYACFYLMCDFGLYWMLDMIRRHFEVKVHKPVPPTIKMRVQGEGVIADMYRALVSMFDPLTSLDGDLDTTACLPNPSKPNYRVFQTIGWIYLSCFFLTLFEAYGMRMRHVVMGMYFPKRARARATWLYNHIIKQRGGFLKFTRRQLRRKYRQDGSVKKASIRGKLIAQFPFMGKFFRLLGFHRKSCLSCGVEGNPRDFLNFYHCATGGCDAVYCADCYSDINNMCTVCMNPVDYGDVSDLSEEVDSSEDEEERQRRIRVSKERKAQIEAREKALSPGQMLAQFKGFADGSVKPETVKSSSGSSGSTWDTEDSEDISSSLDSEEEKEEFLTKYQAFLALSNKPSEPEGASSNTTISGSSDSQCSSQSEQNEKPARKGKASKKKLAKDKAPENTHVSIKTSSSDSSFTSSSSTDSTFTGTP